MSWIRSIRAMFQFFQMRNIHFSGSYDLTPFSTDSVFTNSNTISGWMKLIAMHNVCVCVSLSICIHIIYLNWKLGVPSNLSISKSRAFDRYHFVSNITKQGHSFNKAKACLIRHRENHQRVCVHAICASYLHLRMRCYTVCECVCAFFSFLFGWLFFSFPIYCLTSIKIDI